MLVYIIKVYVDKPFMSMDLNNNILNIGVKLVISYLYNYIKLNCSKIN